MRVCLGMKPTKNISAGGGVKFAIDLEKYLTKKGVKIEYFLDYNDPPDILFMFDFKKYKDDRLDKYIDINDVKRLKSLGVKTKILHRINDTGLHRGGLDTYVKNISELANLSDAIVYVSNFTKNHFSEHIKNGNCKVILNGVDKMIFNTQYLNDFITLRKRDIFNNESCFSNDNIKIITHHFSTNKLKGWDIYEKLDSLVGLVEDIEFTFVGNIPNDITLKNTNVISPKSGKDLADIIKNHDIYLTASRYEACGMHYLEGVSCGLPLLYHKDGGGALDLNEYGRCFYDIDSLIMELYLLKSDYYDFVEKIYDNFNLSSENQCEKYYNFMLEIVSE